METQDKVELNQRDHGSFAHCKQEVAHQQLRKEKHGKFFFRSQGRTEAGAAGSYTPAFWLTQEPQGQTEEECAQRCGEDTPAQGNGAGSGNMQDGSDEFRNGPAQQIAEGTNAE